MIIHFKPMALDIEGKGKVVRIKSGGIITLLLFLTLAVVCFQNYVNTMETAESRASLAGNRAYTGQKAKTQLAKSEKAPSGH